ncbi:hypothetical protein CR513_07314, partial [Mucuna pruriens]
MDFIWVIVDKLTKSSHFIPINIKYSLEKLTRFFRLHGVPSSILLDRDPSLHQALGTEFSLPSTNERTTQSLEDLLRACRSSLDNLLPLVEFTYNNSYHSSIGMAPYEALYGRRCRTPLCWCEPGENLVLGPDVKLIQDKMRVAQSKKKSYHNNRGKDLEFEEGDHVFLKVTP